MKENLIYGLRDPRNDCYKYIGKTTVSTKRPLNHLLNSHNKKISEWIEELQENDNEPIIDIIEHVNDINMLSDREKYWIQVYNNGDLLNIQSLDYDYNRIYKEFFIQLDNVYDLISDIPKLIKLIRKKYKLKQQELANLCGVHRSTISMVESNPEYNVGISLIRKIIEVTRDIDIPTDHKKIRIGVDVTCEHPFNRLHWVGNTVFCNKCKSTLVKPD